MMEDRNMRLLAGLGLGAVISGAAIWSWRNRLEWVEVGVVEDLRIFPIKAGGGFSVEECKLTKYGLYDGEVFDRSFVVVMLSESNKTEEKWLHVSQGMAPPICTIIPTMSAGILTLKPLKGDSLKVDTNKALLTEEKHFDVKGYDCVGFDCGEEVSQWLQKELYPSTESSRRPKVKLMYVGNPDDLMRPARIPPYFSFPQFKKDDLQIFHDNCAFHLFTRQTFDDFNSKLEKAIPLEQMRPNIVVTGRKPYEEDNWAYVKIGDNIQLRTLKPRDTCARINIRPDNGGKQDEVLDVLQTYRVPLLLKNELKAVWSKKPLFGLHMGLDQGGEVKVGDKVMASLVKRPFWLKNSA